MALSIGSLIPTLEGSTEWINGTTSALNLLGHPTVIHFWAISCPICKINMPHLQELAQSFNECGLRLVSVHMPRAAEDQDISKVKAVIEEMRLTEPCAIDNQHIIGKRFQTGGVWPCYFLFDAEGKLRSRASGALGIKMAENSLRRLFELEAT